MNELIEHSNDSSPNVHGFKDFEGPSESFSILVTIEERMMSTGVDWRVLLELFEQKHEPCQSSIRFILRLRRARPALE